MNTDHDQSLDTARTRFLAALSGKNRSAATIAAYATDRSQFCFRNTGPISSSSPRRCAEATISRAAIRGGPKPRLRTGLRPVFRSGNTGNPSLVHLSSPNVRVLAYQRAPLVEALKPERSYLRLPLRGLAFT